MAKTRAYRSQTGNDMVSAEQIRQIRIDRYSGRPTSEQYFSTHRPGQRRPVKHVIKGNSCFFAYIESGGNTEASGGESLQHILFKEALSTLDRVRLRMRSPGSKRITEASIRITAADREHPIARAAGLSPLYADVRVLFEGEDATGKSLAKKWTGQLYIEAHHTHAVGATKQDTLRGLDAAVLEVPIPDVFKYDITDEKTSDEEEARYRRRVKRIIEGETGYLEGVLLSDPSSKEYLELQVHTLHTENQKLEGNGGTLRASLAAEQQKLRACEMERRTAIKALSESRQQLQAVQNARKSTADELAETKTMLSRVRTHRRQLIATISVLALVMILLAFALLR